MSSPQKTPVKGRRPLERLTNLSRSAVQSHFRAAQENPPAGLDRPPLQDFDNSDIWPWITNWIKSTFQTDIEGLFVPSSARVPFPVYPQTGERGHYDLTPLQAADGSIRIALAGDWGTGTDVAQTVADNMVAINPELTIHLGDVYYVGEPQEVGQNCLGQETGQYLGVFWRSGAKGSFALNGNHEMYSGGHGYFEQFLPKLGMPSTQDGKQLTSYFCLETANWRIVAVDTGYNADTISGNCSLPQPLLDWLGSVVNPVKNRKPTVLLSHHQWFSGFGDGDYTTPAQQLAPFFPKQEIVWLWGHEHRLAIYLKYQDPGTKLTAWGRCIGHGGMPVQMPDVQYPNGERAQRVEYWDGLTDIYPNRFQKLADGTVVARNGYAQMTIQGPALTIEYLDFDKTSVLKESFIPGGPAGAWDGTLQREVTSDPELLNHIEYQEGAD